MRASLWGKMLRSKLFAPIVGAVLSFAWLTTAWAAEAEEGHHHLNWTDFGVSYGRFCHCCCSAHQTSEKACLKFSDLTPRRDTASAMSLRLKPRSPKSEQAKAQAKFASLERKRKKLSAN